MEKHFRPGSGMKGHFKPSGAGHVADFEPGKGGGSKSKTEAYKHDGHGMKGAHHVGHGVHHMGHGKTAPVHNVHHYGAEHGQHHDLG